MGAELLLLGGGSGKVSAAAAASSALAASSVGNGRRVVVANLDRRRQLLSTKPSALCQRGSAWQWRHSRTAADKKPPHQRCCATPKLWTPTPEDGKMGFEKEILAPGTGPKPVKGQKVTVHCTGYGKDGDLSKKFWRKTKEKQRELDGGSMELEVRRLPVRQGASFDPRLEGRRGGGAPPARSALRRHLRVAERLTKDSGQQPFEFKIGIGSVIKGWDEGVLTMQVGEVARIKCSPDYGYGAGGFPAWGIRPNSELIFEIEVLSAK